MSSASAFCPDPKPAPSLDVAVISALVIEMLPIEELASPEPIALPDELVALIFTVYESSSTSPLIVIVPALAFV